MKHLQDSQILQALNLSKHSIVYIINISSHQGYISPSVEKLLGHPAENYYQDGFWESLIYPDDNAIIKDFFTRINEITEFEVTLRMKRLDGTYQYIINTGTINREGQDLISIIGNLAPLDEQKKYKKIIDFNNNYIETLFDNIGLIFYAIDKDFRIIAKNKLFDKLVWKRFETVYNIGDSIFSSKIPSPIIKTYKEAYNKCIKNGFFIQDFTLEGSDYKIAFSPIGRNKQVDGISVFLIDKKKERNISNITSFIKSAFETNKIDTKDVIYSLDKEFKFIVFNEPYANVYHSFFKKYPEIGQQTEFIKGDSSISINLANWYKKVLTGEHIDTVLYIGDQVIQLKISPIFNNNNNEISGLTTIGKDITLFNESQKRLIESEEKYKYVVDHVTDIVFQTNQEGTWTYLNRSWENIMEFSLEESIGSLFFKYLHPDDVEKNQILFTPLINKEKNYCSHEIRYITKSGNIKWIRVFATLLLDREGNITGTTGTLTDISKEKENSYRYELLSKNVNDLVCLLETDGTFLYVSPSISNLVGIPNNELIGKNVKQFIHPDDIDSVINFSKFQYESKNLDSYTTYRFKNMNEGYHWIETNAKIFYDDFYGRKLINASSRIIDERKILEQQLLASLEKERQLNQLKSKFVSMASHEFRTPMTAIKTSAELANIYLENNDEINIQKAKKHIQTIDEEIDRLTILINDILMLGKIESESFELTKSKYDISQTIKDIIKKQCELQDDNRKIKFEEEGVAKLIEFDRIFMNLIFENLISNAFKYSKNKKSPIVKVIHHTDKVEIFITDFGVGIPATEQGQMFKSFFRASNVQNIKGTGIGLVLVHYFVELHGGEVTFESKQNIGTTFKLVLPQDVSKNN